ncbi:gamma-glutamyltransferase [Phaeobacter gallaeciensis]|uniref:gamma-glutamyltransferase n=1 Tax=Phaeobacter gallaeciensis TaxID=60890 RepID=UPI00237F3DEF|nr:gamma-glutamyltransferase [Phaeobacter gallaeciensis]MDE4098613.1 gamma-glutamyltransferase [Phaeobacter gallaeciensis]MDE4107423.1 gamma-glutamyltransferase [Phaeobacter gallaeciensis]MDE4111625.1 gamma-glutamyltransferase [Phaeobacter gallaeciensis]MDE4116348.1 gamma-glutamyltransferase [Phaeobacter gallaeciensis]MDE4120819.1 gamma-glutamyltransferase [Phaeobacter gallaeciensis]
MISNLSSTQVTRKTVIETEYGVVAAQHSRAARIGADVLAAGGDAVDAAVAVSFAIGVVEPWMSGPAGGGAAMLWRADEGRAYALNYGMRAPKGLNVADYPLSGEGKAGDLFPWEKVVEDRNVQGATAIAVPGTVDGVGKAHARFGKLPWKDLLQPAIALGREGLAVDWYAALIIASTTRALAQDADAAALFLEDGQWPTIAGWTSLADKRLDMSKMADTLSQLAEAGARDFYEGDIAAAMAADVQAKGGSLSVEDLASYHAELQDPLSFAYRNARFNVMPGLTAGPTFRDAFAHLEDALTPGDQPGAEAYTAYAAALKAAYAKRLSGMGDDGETPDAPGCTTHFSVVDRHGNMVSHTQTLLSIFGSRVVSPQTGLLMNNGIMWFDPEQGKPNSLAPGKRCLMNVCPVLGETVSGSRFAFGASGGRKIVSAVAQLSSFVADFGMDVGEAFHQPRIDVSGGETVVADDSLPADVIAALEAEHNTVTTRRAVFPYAFACPAGVQRKEGRNSGCTEIMSPWGDAITEPVEQK